MPGGIKRFKEDNFILRDLTPLSGRQLIKLKNHAKNNLQTYEDLFSNWEKRLKYTRYMRAIINEAHKLQLMRRNQAIEYYYSLPKEERTPKNWNKYVRKFSDDK